MIPQEAGVEIVPERKRKELDSGAEEQKPAKKSYMSKAREIRLEQNRKAARESRRRKKTMLEELQRSVIFFSRANGTLKQHNEELTRFLVQAQARVSAIESKEKASEKSAAESAVEQAGEHAADQHNYMDQSQAHAVAAQAMYQSKGFPAAAARVTAQSVNGTAKSEPSSDDLPQMQPGATMQAMANFQQAATAAMQAAAQGMQGNGALKTIASPPTLVPDAQRVFSDTMAAIAMQQAATAAAISGQQFLYNPFMAPMIAWQNHQVAAVMAQPSAPLQGTVQSTPQNPAPQLSSANKSG